MARHPLAHPAGMVRRESSAATKKQIAPIAVPALASSSLYRSPLFGITNAPVADMLTVCAKTSRERGMKHIALFLVDRAFPGVTLGRKIDKLGVRASATGEIVLDGVFVPDGHLLGGETGGVEKVGGGVHASSVGADSPGRRIHGRIDAHHEERPCPSPIPPAC